MNGDPKLLRVRAEIEAILQREDIAAHVILHNAPDQAEVFLKLDPSYSKLTMQSVDSHGVIYRLRSNLEDYGGDKEAQRRDIVATANMAAMFADILKASATSMRGLSNRIDKVVGATHTPLKPV